MSTMVDLKIEAVIDAKGNADIKVDESALTSMSVQELLADVSGTELKDLLTEIPSAPAEAPQQDRPLP